MLKSSRANAHPLDLLKPGTRRGIKERVTGFILTMPQIDRGALEEARKANPFQAALFSEEAILYAKQERSAVTRMGMILFPNLAKLVAEDKYGDVHVDHDLQITIDSGSLSRIDAIVNELREGGGKRKPNHKAEIQEILHGANGKTTRIKIRADLYVGDYPTGPIFMEIKSPKPNLDICAESKKKFLIFEAAMREKGGRAYFAFAYNPYITREAYNHSFTKAIMDMDAEVLMGSEMWDKLGGPGTFEELMALLEEAAREVRTKSPSAK